MYKPSHRDFCAQPPLQVRQRWFAGFSPRAFVETALAGTPSAEADSFIAWGNHASLVSAASVAKARKDIAHSAAN